MKMKPISSKWHKIKGDFLISKRHATTIDEAWEKSLAKWATMLEYPKLGEGSSSCGLCNRYFADGCANCPICKITGRVGCDDTPYQEYNNLQERAELEYLFLLFVREATR